MLAYTHNLSLYVCVYIYAVKLKTGPTLAFLKLKAGPSFCFCFVFEKLVLPAKSRLFEKRQQKLVFNVKNWSNFVAQHTWTSF